MSDFKKVTSDFIVDHCFGDNKRVMIAMEFEDIDDNTTAVRVTIGGNINITDNEKTVRHAIDNAIKSEIEDERGRALSDSPLSDLIDELKKIIKKK